MQNARGAFAIFSDMAIMVVNFLDMMKFVVKSFFFKTTQK